MIILKGYDSDRPSEIMPVKIVLPETRVEAIEFGIYGSDICQILELTGGSGFIHRKPVRAQFVEGDGRKEVIRIEGFSFKPNADDSKIVKLVYCGLGKNEIKKYGNLARSVKDANIVYLPPMHKDSW